jgi:predicted amidohydrolase YtcJ
MRVLAATVTRRTRTGDILGPDQRVDVMTALKAMTIWPAWQHFEENEKGSIEKGKLADLVILSDNPMTVDPDKLAELKVRVTIKDGEVIYDADTAAQSAHAGVPFVSDPEAAHKMLLALYEGVGRPVVAK